MKYSALGLAALTISATAFAQTAPSPAAYVYVTSTPKGAATTHIYGYAASSAGKLTPVSGSPVASTVTNVTANGKWLFGSLNKARGPYVADSYSIASNGSIKLVDTASIDAGGREPLSLILDHTGATVYADLFVENNVDAFQSLTVNQSTGKLTPGNVSSGIDGNTPLTFTSNDQFAYRASCTGNSPSIYGFQRRTSDGALSLLGISPTIPAAAVSNTYYCPSAAAADPYNDVVVSLTPMVQDSPSGGPTQLAVYTYDKSGKLTTTSTAANMVDSKVQGTALAMSPQGVYLAAAGTSGLQLFLLHGSKPLTVLTSSVVLPGVAISQMFWDKQQHLYALSATTQKLYIFNITSSGAKQATGSPYSVPSANNMIVLTE